MLKNKITPNLINSKALEICHTLSNTGYQSFIVGGCVRDLLLGCTPKDWDITTDATPEQVMELFPKTIPTGLQHGTITVVMGEGTSNHFEVTTFRTESDYLDGRHPDKVLFVKDIDQDLSRRDLTINAIAYNPITNNLIDPYYGLSDLNSKIIRAVGDPMLRFKEDGLRIMRAARFAARLDYDIDINTFQGMRNTIHTLNMVSKERIQDELTKILMTNNPSMGMLWLLRCGALEIACPYLTSSEILLETIGNLNQCHGELETRIAVLYGKGNPASVQNEMISLKFSNKQIKKTCFLLSILERYHVFSGGDSALAYKSFMATVKNHAPDSWQHTLEQFILFSEALGISSRKLITKFHQEVVFTKQEMKINGYDLIEAGMPAGPELKNILDACYLEILRYPEHNSKEFLLELATSRTFNTSTTTT